MERYHPEAFQLFQLLADPIRWQIVTALAKSHHQLLELVMLTGQPIGIVRDCLAQLEKLGVVAIRQSDADSAVLYYALDVTHMRSLYLAAGASVHPALIAQEVTELPVVVERTRVLFLCTHNSARSQIAEGLLRHYSQGRVDVYSAGSRPTAVHPLAIRVLGDIGIDISQHTAHDVRDYVDQAFDYVVTVCDEVREVCPSFPGDTQRMHWSFPDPTRSDLSSEEQLKLFRHTMIHMATMIHYLLHFIVQKHQRSIHQH